MRGVSYGELRDMPTERLVREVDDRLKRKFDPHRRTGEGYSVNHLDWAYLAELTLRHHQDEREP